jgi:catechol 2,3-dioxygenase-like lactoylglutathione lyase family enzyme
MLDHLAIQCADVARSAHFYDAVLVPLGGERIMEYDGPTIGFGAPPMPDFWLGPRVTGEGFREAHIASAHRIGRQSTLSSARRSQKGPMCSTSPEPGLSITPTITARSFATRMGTTSRPCVTRPSDHRSPTMRCTCAATATVGAARVIRSAGTWSRHQRPA